MPGKISRLRFGKRGYGIYTIIILMIFSVHAYSQGNKDILLYEVKSEVTLNGTSNVKNFSCIALKDYYENPNKVIVTHNPGVFTYQNARVDIDVDKLIVIWVR